MLVKLPEPGDQNDFPYVRIDRFDCWGLDHTLSYIILPALKILRESKHGIPAQFVPNDYHCDQMVFEFIDAEQTSGIAHAEGEKNWNACMDEMIFSFEEVVSGRFHGGAHGLRMMKRSHAEYLAYNERVQHGFDLFGKHFLNLWD